MDLLLSIVILVLVIGLLLYLIELIPADTRLKQFARVAIMIVGVIVILRMLWPLLSPHPLL